MYPKVEINESSLTVILDDKGTRFVICKDPDGSKAVCVCGSNGDVVRLPLEQNIAQAIAMHLFRIMQ